MSKKILIIAVVATVLIALLTVFALIAPGSRNDNPATAGTTSPNAGDTTPAQSDNAGTTEIDSGIPDSVNFGDREITFFIWSDFTMLEFYTDEISGNLVGDEIHERNAQVEDKLGVKLKYVEEPGSASHMNNFNKKLEADITSGECAFDIVGGYSRAVPAMALSGHLLDLAETSYIDLEHPWWPETLVNECMVNNKLYFCSGDISTNLLWMMIGTFFNKELITQYDLESPYDLVKNNQWTLDKMIEMCANRYNDIDGAGEKDEGDRFGCALYNINIDAFFNGSGFIALRKDNNGTITISPDMTNQRLHDMIEKLGAFVNSPDVFNKDDVSVRDIFFEQRALFTTDRCFIVAGKDNGPEDKIEFEYGIVPQPKLTADQANYSTNVGHPFTMYGISVGVKGDDIDACSATLEQMACESYKRVTPAVFESAMKIKYASDETTTEMYDILRGTVVFDLGRLYSTQIGDVYKTVRQQILSNSKTFASQYKITAKMMEAGIKTILAAFED